MGLFGGFKAKFTKDSTTKNSKSVKKDEVVCLGYRIYSEFDNPPQYLQASSEQPRKPPQPIKTVASRPKSTPTVGKSAAPQPSTSVSPIEPQTVTKPKNKKSSKKKEKGSEKGNKHVSTASLTLTNSNTEKELINSSTLNRETSSSNPNIGYTATSQTVKLRNDELREEFRSAPNSVYVRGKTSSFNPNNDETTASNSTNNSSEIVIEEVQTKPPKSILKQKPYTEHLSSQVSNAISIPENNAILINDENVYSDNEYDRTVTLASSKKSNYNGYTTETADYMSATQAVTKSSSTQVATYVHTEVNSSKSDSTANVTDNNSSPYYSGGYTSYSTTRSIGSTSNHAANIFFGGDEEPEVQRPRRANLGVLQSGEERRSSIEC